MHLLSLCFVYAFGEFCKLYSIIGLDVPSLVKHQLFVKLGLTVHNVTNSRYTCTHIHTPATLLVCAVVVVQITNRNGFVSLSEMYVSFANGAVPSSSPLVPI